MKTDMIAETDTFAFAKANIDYCDKSHNCKNQSFSLPTRVLDVSGQRLLLYEPPEGDGTSG